MGGIVMERKIGEEFEYNGVKLKVVEEDFCENCYFRANTKMNRVPEVGISQFPGVVLKRKEKTINQFNSLKLKTKK